MPLILLQLTSALSGDSHRSPFRTYLEFNHRHPSPLSPPSSRLIWVIVITPWVVLLLTLLPSSTYSPPRKQRVFTDSSHRPSVLCLKPSSSACLVSGEAPVALLWLTRLWVVSEDHPLSFYLFTLPHSAPYSLVPPSHLLVSWPGIIFL